MVWCEPAANSGGHRGSMQLAADRGRGAWPAAGRAAQNAEQRADRRGPAQLEPGVELLPRPAVDPVLPPATALSCTDQDGAALAVKIGLSQRKRLALPQTGTPEHDDHPAQPHCLRPIPRRSHHRDGLLHGRRIRRIPKALVARDAAPERGSDRPDPRRILENGWRRSSASRRQLSPAGLAAYPTQRLGVSALAVAARFRPERHIAARLPVCHRAWERSR